MTDFSIAISRWKRVTEAEALDEDWDMIPALTSYQKTLHFCQDLECRRPQLERLISRHLGIPTTDFVLLGLSHWVWGSFNVCLPIDIKTTARGLPTQAILRLPLPFRSGEDYSPGNVDEKLRSEAATYIWLRRLCPSIPIPRLLAIGVPGSRSFTAIENESIWNRFVWQFRRGWAWLHGDWLPPFFVHFRESSLSDLGYLLLEYVVEGRPLSSTWQQYRHDEGRCINLYRGLSKILLDLERLPLPRIGSWTMDNRGIISLTNRPLIDLTMLWSRHEIPTSVPRDSTYVSADSFLLDMLAYHDIRMRYQLNSILGRPDGIYQLSALTALRALLPKFWDHRSRNGPFVLTLPDLHQSNIFVDDDWNVVGVIDLEFAPVQPAQMVCVPVWLSGRSIDELHGLALDEYKVLYERFVGIVEAEEVARQQGNEFSQRLRDDWRTGRLWYNAALRNSNAFPLIFEQSIQPKFFDKFDADVDGLSLMRLWDTDCEEFIAAKLKDKAKYDTRIREIFAAAKLAQSSEAQEKKV